MDGIKSVTVATNTQDYKADLRKKANCFTIQLPNALLGITPSTELATNKQSWNTNEEIASLLIAFDKHKEWQQWELKIRPVSGSMLLYNRNKVRHRRDGYCWKKRKAGKTIREDHMKLKVQGIECIYGSYVHSAILPTFHRRSYWLLQNPDLVLVHYLNVPIPDNSKLTIPTLPPYMDKKEWTKEDLVDQLRPMFSTGQHGCSRESEQLIEDTIAAIVQRLLGQQETQCKNKPHRCDVSCDKNCPHSRNRRISPKDGGPAPSCSSVPGRLVSLLQPLAQRLQSAVTATQVTPSTHTMLVTSTANQPVSTVTRITDHMTPSSTPLILNLSDFQGSNGFIIVSGQATTQIPIINSSSAPQPSVTSCSAQQQVQLINAPIMSVPTLVPPDLSKESADTATSVPMQISSSVDDFHPTMEECVRAPSVHAEDKQSHPVSMFATTSGFTLPQHVISCISTSTFDTDMPLGDKFPIINQSDLSTSANLQGDNSGPGSNCDVFKAADLPFPPQSDLSLDGLDLLDFAEISKLYPTLGDSCIASPNSIPHSSVSMPDDDKVVIPLLNCAMCLQNQSAQQQQHIHPSQQLHSCGPEQPQSCSKEQLHSQQQLHSSHAASQQHLFNQQQLHSQQHTCISSLQQQHHHPIEQLQHQMHPCSQQQLHSQQHHLQTQQQLHNPCSQSVTSDRHVTCRETLSEEKDKMLSFSNLHSMLPIKDEGESNPPKTLGAGDSSVAISDFSPDWSYTEGGSKVLVTGPWCSSSSTYLCVFGRKTVPASLVQSGVLRCFAPAHDAGLVTLEVAMDSCVISNSVVFEYKLVEAREMRTEQLDWYSVDENQLQLMLLDRLEQIEKRLSPALGSKVTSASSSQSPVKSTDCEGQILRYCDFLSGRSWQTTERSLGAGQLGLTLLHLASALGYHKLVNRLLKWRSQNPSSVIEHEADVNCTDHYSSTPLMWACARGHVTTALLLYNWNSGPLEVCNKAGLLPLDIALQKGHHVLADHLDLMEQDSDMQTDSAVMDATLDSLDPFLSPVKDVTSSPSPLTSMTSTPVIHARKNQSSPLKFCTPPPRQDAMGPDSHMNTLHIEIPPPSRQHSFPATESRLMRRFSEQDTASCLRRRFNKRFSMEIFPDSSMMNPDYCSNATDLTTPASLRIANSEPDLGTNIDTLTGADNPMISEDLRDVNSPDLFLQAESLLGIHRLTDNDDGVFAAVTSTLPVQAPIILGSSSNLAVAMDTDEISSVRSESPFIDVEKVSSDEEEDLRINRQSGSISDGSATDSQHQMVTLANQIIAAMPERIKLSPSRCDEGVVTESPRERSESHSSITSQGSPHTSSYGDDSGISTPLGEGLSFDEYRYREIGTPASSLSPDSTCLPSPYSPYSFQLDSPPPTTADFNEYFNAPTTFMEKDFSQLTLSDHEQRKLYEAAKVIQSAFRIFRDKQQQQQQLQKEIEAAILIQSYYRRYKQYIFYKKMTQAAVLIQSQFRSYSAQKRYKKSRDAAVVIQNQYRTYKEHERFKKSRNAAVIIQQRFRNHYQRKQNQEVASNLLQLASESNDNSPAQDVGTSKDEAVATEKDVKKPGDKSKKKSRSRSRSSSCTKTMSDVTDSDLKRTGTNSERKNSKKGDNYDLSDREVSSNSCTSGQDLTESS